MVVSFLDIEPHELGSSSFSAGGWKCVFANGVKSGLYCGVVVMHIELTPEAQVS